MVKPSEESIKKNAEKAMWPNIIIGLLANTILVWRFLSLPEDYINYTPPLLFHLIAGESAIGLIFGLIIIGVFFHTHNTSSWHIIASLLTVILTFFLAFHFFFTTIFAAIGLFGPHGITYNKWDALYFSIMTWTTTGYGDLRPIGDGRWYACVEALLGTFFTGFVLVAFIYHLNLIAKQPIPPNPVPPLFVKKPLNKFESLFAGIPSRDIWIGALAALIFLGAIVLGLAVFRNVFRPTLPAVKAWFGAGVNVVQSIFLIGTLVLAVLTYHQARKTILQPLRTEVFKEQIKVFGKIQETFLSKTQLDLWTELGLIDLVGVNCQAMVDTYARVVLGYQYQWPTRDWESCKRKGNSINLLELATADPKVTALLLSRSTYLPDYDPIIQPINGDKFAGWKNYNHPVIFYHDSFVDAQKRLNGLAASPVLPNDCQKRIRAILDYMDKFPGEIRIKIAELSETLPGKVPTAQDFEWDKFKYVYQQAYAQISDLTPAAQDLVNCIRGHLNPDDLQNV